MGELRYNRNKTNTTYFENIPKQRQQTIQEKEKPILESLREVYTLKERRNILKEQQVETRKRIYNLSLEIEEKERLLYGEVFKRL